MKLFSTLIILFMWSGIFSQITLGGVTVPKESCWVYIFIGHSNMSGRAIKRDTLTNPKLWNYALHTTPNGWRLATESMYIDRTINADLYSGPGMTFLNQMNAKYPDHYFCLFLNGEGRATASVYLNNQSISGHKLYEEIMAPLKSQVKGKVVFGGILAYLGIVEPYVNDEAACRRFASDMKNLVMLMRTELGDQSIPFVMSQYEMEAKDAFAASRPLPQIIIRQQDSLCKILPRSILIPTNGIPMKDGDDHHWDCTGHDEFTKRMIDSLIARGYAPESPVLAEAKGSPSSKKPQLTVTTNPFHNTTELIIAGSYIGTVIVSIYDVSGKFVGKKMYNADCRSISIDKINYQKILSSGMYYVICEFEYGLKVSKTIIKM